MTWLCCPLFCCDNGTSSWFFHQIYGSVLKCATWASWCPKSPETPLFVQLLWQAHGQSLSSQAFVTKYLNLWRHQLFRIINEHWHSNNRKISSPPLYYSRMIWWRMSHVHIFEDVLYFYAKSDILLQPNVSTSYRYTYISAAGHFDSLFRPTTKRHHRISILAFGDRWEVGVGVGDLGVGVGWGGKGSIIHVMFPMFPCYDVIILFIWSIFTFIQWVPLKHESK